MACTRARRRFFLDRADDGDAHASDLLGRRSDERGERTLRVDRAASDELAVFDAHRDLPAHGIDVTEEDDVRRSVADLTHRVARVVALELRGVAVRAREVERIHVHVCREPRAELRTLASEDVHDAGWQISR